MMREPLRDRRIRDRRARVRQLYAEFATLAPHGQHSGQILVLLNRIGAKSGVSLRTVIRWWSRYKKSPRLPVFRMGRPPGDNGKRGHRHGRARAWFEKNIYAFDVKFPQAPEVRAVMAWWRESGGPEVSSRTVRRVLAGYQLQTKGQVAEIRRIRSWRARWGWLRRRNNTNAL